MNYLLKMYLESRSSVFSKERKQGQMKEEKKEYREGRKKTKKIVTPPKKEEK